MILSGEVKKKAVLNGEAQKKTVLNGHMNRSTAPGPPGPPGVTPDFSIGAVTTGEPGTPADASITGTPENPILNLTIPRGEDGSAGTNFWFGTREEYNALPSIDPEVCYCIEEGT